MSQFFMLINNQLVGNAETFDVINPSTEETFAKAPHASKQQVDQAVEAAAKSFTAWTMLPIKSRKALLKTALDIIETNNQPLSELLVREQGKTLRWAKAEVESSLEHCRNILSLELPIQVIADTDQYRTEVHRRAIGVIVGITPWNFPIFCGLQKLVPTLAWGNTFVWKPSPFTPLTALFIGSLLKDVFPPGVINIVTGNDKHEFNVGSYISNHPQVNKVSFTGSVKTGRLIFAACANDVKRVTLEMGGNDAAIIRADCDPKEIAPKVFFGAMFTTGQICCAVKRIFVHESIYGEFCEEMVKCAKATKFGDGFEDGVDYGPINNAMQFNRVKMLVNDAKENGAKILCGGEPLKDKGYFYPATIVTEVKEGIKLVDEEQFGPVIPILSYKDDQEAISRANNTIYGLGGSIWSKDIRTANRLAMLIQAGTVWVNDHVTLTGGPFGGYKASGLGREFGKADIETFTECQTLKFAK